MPTYRAHLVGEDGHYRGVRVLLACATDAQAVSEAAHFAGACGIDIWAGDRLVASLPRSAEQATPKDDK